MFLQNVKNLPLPGNKFAANQAMLKLDEGLKKQEKEIVDFFSSLKQDEAFILLLESVFGNSPFLSRLILKNLSFFALIIEKGADFAFSATIAAINEVLNDKASPYYENKGKFMDFLRQQKQQCALVVALADISNLWKVEKVTQALSRFAEEALKSTIEFLLIQAVKNGSITINKKGGKIFSNSLLLQDNSGIIVIAMGKLGAQELNYSSDIDLIFFYEPEKFSYIGKKTIRDFHIDLVREVVEIIDTRTKEGYVFRVDLRLRPDPSSTPVAMSVDSAINYYESVGQNWERAAMIKARQVAGDYASGKKLFNDLNPYIWRKYLDFASIQDIHSIKRQISSTKEQIPQKLAGYNIKLGHGGIREIEFFVQTQQLIWGGRNPDLRERSTLLTLQALAINGRISKKCAQDLSSIYRYLRNLEHRLQMIADVQTHKLPEKTQELEQLAIFLRCDSIDEMYRNLRQFLLLVQKYYAELFKNSPQLSYGDLGSLVFTGIESDPETLDTLTKIGFKNARTVSQTIRKWHHGRYKCTRTKRARELLTELMPVILKAFSKLRNPDEAFLKFDEFLSRLPTSIQLFSLISANPQILDVLSDIMGGYTHISDNLAKKPFLLEYVLYSDFLEPLQDKEQLKASLQNGLQLARNYEEILDAARRWTHDRQFRIGVQLIKKKIAPAKAREYLSDIADVVLPVLFAEVKREFCKKRGNISNGNFAVIAMGKLGSREFTFDSDIDLVFVHDVLQKSKDIKSANKNKNETISINEYYARLSRRFITAFTSLTREGRLYEVDIRLRPSGNDGPISSNLQAFDKYYEESAWIFEFMALTRARVILGSSNITKKINKLILKHLCKKRDKQVLVADILSIRQKIDSKYRTHDVWTIKYIRGGLIDIEFIAQYLQLLYANAHPDILDTKTQYVFSNMQKCGILKQQEAEELIAITNFYMDIQTITRLAYGRQTQFTQFPESLKYLLTSSLNRKSFIDLEKELISYEKKVSNYFIQFFDKEW